MDSRRDWKGKAYARRECGTCGYVVEAPAGYIRRAFATHATKCVRATPEARAEWKLTGRWPIKGKS